MSDVLLGGTAIVVAADAPTAIRQAAQDLKPAMGSLIQLCGGVDDDIEIQAAIQAIVAIGGVLQLSTGSFNTAEPIILPSVADTLTSVIIRGQGWGATAINYGGTDFAFKGISPTYTTFPQLCDLRVFSDNGAGIYMEHLTYFGHPILRNVYVGSKLGGAAMSTHGIYLKNCHEASLENVKAYRCSTGILFDTMNAASMRNVLVAECCDGIEVIGCKSLEMSTVVAEDNARYGIKFGNVASGIEGCRAAVLSNIYAENNISDGLRFEFGNTNIVLNAPLISCLDARKGLHILENGGAGFTINGLHWPGGGTPIVIGAGSHRVHIIGADQAALSAMADGSDDITILNGMTLVDPAVKGQFYYTAAGAVMRSTG